MIRVLIITIMIGAISISLIKELMSYQILTIRITKALVFIKMIIFQNNIMTHQIK